MEQQRKQRARKGSVVGSPEQEQLQAEWGAHVKDLLAAYVKKTGAAPNLSLRGATGYGCNYLQPSCYPDSPGSCGGVWPDQTAQIQEVGAGGSSSSPAEGPRSPTGALTIVEFERLQLGKSGQGVNDSLSETSGRWRAGPGERPGRWLRDGPPPSGSVQQMESSGAQQGEWTSEDEGDTFDEDTGEGESGEGEGEVRGGPSGTKFNNDWDDEDEDTILRRLMWIKYHVKLGDLEAAEGLGWDGDLDYIMEGDEEEEQYSPTQQQYSPTQQAQATQMQAVQAAQAQVVFHSCDLCDYNGINAGFLNAHKAEVHGVVQDAGSGSDQILSRDKAQAQAQAWAQAPAQTHTPGRGQGQGQAQAQAGLRAQAGLGARSLADSSSAELEEARASLEEIEKAFGGASYNHSKARGSMKFGKVAKAEAALAAARTRLQEAAAKLETTQAGSPGYQAQAQAQKMVDQAQTQAQAKAAKSQEKEQAKSEAQEQAAAAAQAKSAKAQAQKVAQAALAQEKSQAREQAKVEMLAQAQAKFEAKKAQAQAQAQAHAQAKAQTKAKAKAPATFNPKAPAPAPAGAAAFSSDEFEDYNDSLKEIAEARGGASYNHSKARGSMKFGKVAKAEASLLAARTRLEAAAAKLGEQGKGPQGEKI